MTRDILWFHGSADDIDTLRLALIAKGFQEHKDTSLEAMDATVGQMAHQSIGFIAVIGIGECIRVFLKTRGKRMVSREVSKKGEKLVIREDYSADEVERFLKVPPHEKYIEDDKNDTYSNPEPIATAAQFKTALLAVEQTGIPKKHREMLTAHCRADNHEISTGQLAKEVGYPDHNTVNIQYGKLAHHVADELHIILPETPDKKPHWCAHWPSAKMLPRNHICGLCDRNLFKHCKN
jgi:hypothetical protein